MQVVAAELSYAGNSAAFWRGKFINGLLRFIYFNLFAKRNFSSPSTQWLASNLGSPSAMPLTYKSDGLLRLDLFV
jgi:hypothetical protein